MHPFVAIDFETANPKRGSACSVALVRFDESGRAAGALSTLLRPHDSMGEFHPINRGVHGIGPGDVAAAPQWHQFHPHMLAFVGDLPLVAHNMPFDGKVLDELSGLYRLPLHGGPRLCTLRLARSLLKGELEKMTLPAVYRHCFPRESFTHHRAEDDAMAAGRIFARWQAEHGIERLMQHGQGQGTRGEARRSPSRGAASGSRGRGRRPGQLSTKWKMQ